MYVYVSVQIHVSVHVTYWIGVLNCLGVVSYLIVYFEHMNEFSTPNEIKSCPPWLPKSNFVFTKVLWGAVHVFLRNDLPQPTEVILFYEHAHMQRQASTVDPKAVVILC